MKPNDLISIRPFDAKTDTNFIFATWLRQLWFSPTNESTLSKSTFMRIHHGRVEKIMHTLPIKIACLKDDPDTIVAYCVPDEITYIKKDWRELSAVLNNLFKETK